MDWPLMTDQELHEFGIQMILPYVEKEGVTIEHVNTKLKMNPQIVGKRWGSSAHIVVRTACHPEMGALRPGESEHLIAWADKHNAIAFFAGVGLVCSNYPDKSPVRNPFHESLPIRHGGFYIIYRGLLVMTMSDRVRIWGDDRTLSERWKDEDIQ